MTIRVSVKNEEAAGTAAVLSVEVVTVGDASSAAERHHLAAQESVTVHVHGGQFLMVDEHDVEGP